MSMRGCCSMQLGAALVEVWLGPHRAVCRHRKLLAWPACSRQRHTLWETNSVLTFIDHTRAMLQIIFCLLNRTFDINSCYKSLNNLKSPKIS